MLAGCWGHVWPHRGMVIDLTRAHASVTEVADVAGEFLLSHRFTRMGKAGYDAINGTTTVFDYQGPDGLIASIGPKGNRDFSKAKAVSIRFNQDRSVFSSEAQRLFDDLASELRTKWPNSITVGA